MYYDPDENTVHIGVRGTKLNAQDLTSDLHIVAGNRSGHEEEVAEQILNAMSQFDEQAKFEVSGHSLGGLEVMNIFMDSDRDELLNRVGEVNLYNPGLSPIYATDTAQQAAIDPRMHLYLNTGDLISNTMAGFVTDESDVHWGHATNNPLTNHSLAQWEGEPVSE